MLPLLMLSVLVTTLGQGQPPTGAAVITFADALGAASFEELWRESALIARVRVNSVRVQMLPARGSTPPRPITHQSATVLEVLKGTRAAHGPVTIRTPVGILKGDDGRVYESRAHGRRPFVIGEEVLVFLRPAPSADTYDIAYGSVGAYQLDYGAVAIPPLAREWPIFGGRTSMPKAEFLSAIRQFQATAGK